MKYKVTYCKNFEKDYARCKKRGYDMSLLKEVIALLAETGTLPTHYKPHKLSGQRMLGVPHQVGLAACMDAK